MKFLLDKLFLLELSVEEQLAILLFVMVLIIIAVIVLTIIKKAK